MAGKKIINRQDIHTEVNIDTGEMRRIVTDTHIGLIDSEPDYIKIYIGTQLCLNNLDPNLAPYIIAFGPYMTYANDSQYQHMVNTNSMVREGVAATLGVSDKRVEQIIKKLVDNGIFIPMYKRFKVSDGVFKEQRKRGMYFVNPWVVAKGKWSDIKTLQQKIDFVKGESSYLIADDDGARKIKCALPQKFHQYTLDDYDQPKEE